MIDKEKMQELYQVQKEAMQKPFMPDKTHGGCPECGGPTTYDRSFPPEPYVCEDCDVWNEKNHAKSLEKYKRAAKLLAEYYNSGEVLFLDSLLTDKNKMQELEQAVEVILND